MLQSSYSVTLRIMNMQVQHKYYPSRSIVNAEELRKTEVLMINCKFYSNIYLDKLLLFASTNNGSVQFINCQFICNTIKSPIFVSNSRTALIKLFKTISIEFSNCEFYSENDGIVIEAFGEQIIPMSVVVKTTNYTAFTLDDHIKLYSDFTTYNYFIIICYINTGRFSQF